MATIDEMCEYFKTLTADDRDVFERIYTAARKDNGVPPTFAFHQAEETVRRSKGTMKVILPDDVSCWKKDEISSDSPSWGFLFVSKTFVHDDGYLDKLAAFVSKDAGVKLKVLGTPKAFNFNRDFPYQSHVDAADVNAYYLLRE